MTPTYSVVEHLLGSWLTPQILSRPGTPSRSNTPSENREEQVMPKISADSFSMIKEFSGIPVSAFAERSVTLVPHKANAHSYTTDENLDLAGLFWRLTGQLPPEINSIPVIIEQVPPILGSPKLLPSSRDTMPIFHQGINPDVLEPLDTPLPSGTTQHNFKTKLCWHFKKRKKCLLGDSCGFAHGKDELRPLKVPYKYKTVLCKNYSQTGWCKYGSKCLFAHGKGEFRTKEENMESQNPGYKTRLCIDFLNVGVCENGSNCHHAHGYGELRGFFS